MLQAEYIQAVEKRLAWARFAEHPRIQAEWENTFSGAPHDAYTYALTHGELYVMVPKFCEMVQGARRAAPADLTFELPWVLTPAGWVWFATPFKLPILKSQVQAMEAFSPIDQLAEIIAGHDPTSLDDALEVRVYPALVEDWVRELPPDQGAALRALADHYDHGVHGDALKPLAQAVTAAANRPRRAARRLTVNAMGWYRTDDTNPVPATRVGSGLGRNVSPDVCVLIYGDRGKEFVPLAHFGLKHGGPLGTRIESFEAWAAFGHDEHPAEADAPYQDSTGLWQHEIQLAYTIFHLMAQKLTLHMRTPTDRATRRRAERTQQEAPPFIEVVTLRRLEADRHRDPTGHEVDWQWQWSVIGHWRWQYYETQGVSKRIWIHTFTKGPKDKPFKQPSVKIFAARR